MGTINVIYLKYYNNTGGSFWMVFQIFHLKYFNINININIKPLPIVLRNLCHKNCYRIIATDSTTTYWPRNLLQKYRYGFCYNTLPTDFTTNHATKLSTEKDPWNLLWTPSYGIPYGHRLWNSPRNTRATESSSL